MSILVSLVSERLRKYKNRELAPNPWMEGLSPPAIKLNQNENLLTRDWAEAFYPDEHLYQKLIGALVRAYGVPAEWIMLTSGADAGIHNLNEVFCGPGNKVLVHRPTFFAYETFADKFQATVHDCPLIREPGNFRLDTRKIIDSIKTPDSGLKVVYLCNPNNPTGTYFDEDEILAIVGAAREAGIAVVVDEAYIEVSGKESILKHMGEEPSNLIVLRTMSKAYSFAGARVSSIITNDPAFKRILQHVSQPTYPVSSPACEKALEILDPSQDAPIRESWKRIRAEREILHEALVATTGIKSHRSAGNFLLFGVENARNAFRHFAQHGILPGNPQYFVGLAEEIRMTVGLPDQNRAVLEAAKTYAPH